MSRKHFRAVADTLSRARMFIPVPVFEEMVENMVADFRATNPRFDAARFRDACYAD